MAADEGDEVSLSMVKLWDEFSDNNEIRKAKDEYEIKKERKKEQEREGEMRCKRKV